MKILVLTPTYLPIIGGAEAAIFEVYSRLAARHEVLIVTPRHRRKSMRRRVEHDQAFECSAISVRRFRDWCTSAKTRFKFLWGWVIPPASVSFLWALRRAVRSFRPDVINVHYVIPGGLALWYAERVLKLPVLLSLPGRDDVFGPANPYFVRQPRFMRFILKRATKVTVLSRYSLGGETHRHGVAMLAMGVAALPESGTGEEVRRRFSIARDAFVLMTLGRLDSVKRVDLLIAGLAEVRTQLPHTHLLVVGTGPEEPALRSAAQALGVENAVHFTGYVPQRDLAAHFRAADLFVFASEFETFGIAVAQALAAELPVVAFESSCLKEVVSSGQDGELVSREVPGSFSTAVCRLLQDPVRRAAYAKNAGEKARRCFSWDVVAARYEELLEEARRLKREDLQREG